MMAHVVQDTPESPSRSGTYRYYEGFVEKKGPKDKSLEKRWAVLEGDKMYFYQNKVGNRELSTQKPLDTLVLDRNTTAIPEQKDRCRMTVKCKHATYKIKASSAEELENIWLKVVAVSSANMPKERDLLPGQKQMFADIASKEQDRKSMPPVVASGDSKTPGGSASFSRRPLQKSNTTIGLVSSAPPTPSRHSAPAGGQWDESDDVYKFYPDHLKLQLPTPPPWFFHKISRDHAEQILLKNPDQGHLLIRVSESHPGEYSLSVRQDMGGIVVKHYRFRWETNTYKLLIDEVQPELLNMYDLIMFFIERSGGNLKPIQTRDPKVLKLPDNLYEHRFQQLTQGINPENGEAPYRNRLSLQRSKTVNNGRPQEGTYLIPENNSSDANGSVRPNRVSLPATFNQGYNGNPSRGTIPQPIQEGVQQDEFTGINRGFGSQSVRVSGSNGYNLAPPESPDANNGYMIMSANRLGNVDKGPYVNIPKVSSSSDLNIRPLPVPPPGSNRKRSLSTTAIPTGFVPEAPTNFLSNSSNDAQLRSQFDKLGIDRQ
ncbi:uncharacterized protein [Amphiura filiformis]|uniref:uncharacterized protein isoform X3 n=1 Tax=Amphiura filiformis TaxID=82378 RepID=UPI003B224D47